MGHCIFKHIQCTVCIWMACSALCFKLSLYSQPSFIAHWLFSVVYLNYTGVKTDPTDQTVPTPIKSSPCSLRLLASLSPAPWRSSPAPSLQCSRFLPSTSRAELVWSRRCVKTLESPPSLVDWSEDWLKVTGDLLGLSKPQAPVLSEVYCRDWSTVSRLENVMFLFCTQEIFFIFFYLWAQNKSHGVKPKPSIFMSEVEPKALEYWDIR